MFNLLKSNSDTTLKRFIEQCPIAIAELDSEYCITHPNTACRAIFNIAIGDTPRITSFFNEQTAERFNKAIIEFHDSDTETMCDHYHIDIGKDEDITISLELTKMLDITSDNTSRIYMFCDDITEEKNLEMRFAHSQKMQAVGQLAGGVAHDFNNLLTAMIGFCDLLLMRHPAGDPSFADIMQIKQNANRAANLVRQLLAFSRRQTLQPKELDLVDLISEISNLVRRLIGENIELNIKHEQNIWPVKVDQGQLEQVLINLAVNARDAMKEGGKLNLYTHNKSITHSNELDKALRMPPQEEGITPGEYVEIIIEDSGTGIPDNVIDNIFEPFFSTKELGSGTGLGLSTVYGIIKQTGGYIYLKTESGKGTSFHVYIPRSDAQNSVEGDTEPKEQHTTQDLTGAATILLVEDETPVRIFATRALQNKGYSVLEADCGESGIEIYELNKDKIEFIITDVVMPGINGPTMVETLDERFSEEMKTVQVIFMSGYTEEAFSDGYQSDRDFNFLSKPFTLKQLAAKLKELT